MTNSEIENKLKYILLEISRKKGGEDALVEILSHSKFVFQTHWNNQVFPNAFNLEIHVTPDVFTKHYSQVEVYEKVIRNRINESSKLIIDKIKILPDYEKLELVNSMVYPILTEWEEINQLQEKLIENLQRSTHSTDFQNIGNTSRTIMDKLARQVFDPINHKPKDPTKEVQNGKFKNQLHAYIDKVLSGDKNANYRKLAKSAIEFVENSADLMNSTTHKLDAERHLAEVCVIATISAISIVNLIRKLE